jgi:YD repeat-containing protein
VRTIDEQGRVTEYVYDPAGNLLQVNVSGAGSAQPPVVTGVSPSAIRRGETKSFVVSGTGLTGAQLSVTGPSLEISDLQTSATQIAFTLAVAADAPLGPQSFSIANAGGSASMQVSVNPLLPALHLTPQPVAIALGAAPSEFTVTLSNADNIEHVVSVASGDTAIVTVSPSSVTFSAGQTSATITLTPQGLGTTMIDFSAPGLAGISIQAGVGSPPLGQATGVTRAVSVHLRAGTPGAPAGNAMSAGRPVSVHLPAATPGAPAGNAMSASQPVSVSMP